MSEAKKTQKEAAAKVKKTMGTTKEVKMKYESAVGNYTSIMKLMETDPLWDHAKGDKTTLKGQASHSKLMALISEDQFYSTWLAEKDMNTLKKHYVQTDVLVGKIEKTLGESFAKPLYEFTVHVETL